MPCLERRRRAGAPSSRVTTDAGVVRPLRNLVGIAGRRLDEYLLERRLPYDPPVRYAVQAHSTRQAYTREAGLFMEIIHHAKDYLLADLLYRRGHIFVKTLQLRFGLSWRPSEEGIEIPVRHLQAVVVGEILHVQPEAPVLFDPDQLLHYRLVEPRLAVRGEPHDLVLPAIHLESQIIRKGAV